MSNEFSRLIGTQWMLGETNTQTKTGFALGSAYTYASAGAALGFRFTAPVSGNLTDVWFFVTAILGTPGVTTVELRNWNTTTAAKPGTTLHTSTTITPGATANKWIDAHFSGGSLYSVVQGTPYWIVLGDAVWSSGKTTTVDDISALDRPTSLLSTGRSYTTTDDIGSI